MAVAGVAAAVVVSVVAAVAAFAGERVVSSFAGASGAVAGASLGWDRAIHWRQHADS